MPPPSGILGRMQERAANASAQDLTRRIQQTERLRRAEELLHREQARGNELAREAQRYSQSGMHEEAAQAAAAHERQLQRLNRAEEAHNRILEEQGSLARQTAQAVHNAGQRISNGITNIATASVVRMRAQIERAHHALLQNTRRFEDINVTGMANAVAGYEGALAQAIRIGIKYGQSVDEITQIQHSLVDAMHIDVSHGGWVEGVSTITEEFANMASRAGRTVAEVAQVQLEMSRTFGRGSQGEMVAFANQMTRVSMIPEVLRQRLEAAGLEAGQTFNNREFMGMIEHWTQQFGDQASNIGDMATNMGLFQLEAYKAGHSMRTVNAMTNALVQGTTGRHGDDVNTVRAGQALQRAYRAGSPELNAAIAAMNPEDQAILMERMSSRDALSASDTYHMLKGTNAGINAMLESVIGVYGNRGAISSRMLRAQGFDTGDEQTQMRLDRLLRQRHEQGASEDNTAAIRSVLDEAQSIAAQQQTARDNQYTNVAIAATAAEQTAEAAQQLVQNTSFGGPIVAAIAGVAALMGAASPALANEWEDIFMGRVSADTGDSTRNTQTDVSRETDARQATATSLIRREIQRLSEDESFDETTTEGRARLVGLLARARRDVSDEQFESVLNKVSDVGFTRHLADNLTRSALSADASRAATSGQAGAAPASYTAALDAAAARARSAPPTPSARPRLQNNANQEAAGRERQRRERETPPTVPTTPNRQENANQLINQGTAPASTPASAPTPAPAPTPPARTSTPTDTRGASITQVGNARGRLAANGSLEVPTVLRIENFVPLSAEADAINASQRPIGAPA